MPTCVPIVLVKNMMTFLSQVAQQLFTDQMVGSLIPAVGVNASLCSKHWAPLCHMRIHKPVCSKWTPKPGETEISSSVKVCFSSQMPIIRSPMKGHINAAVDHDILDHDQQSGEGPKQAHKETRVALTTQCIPCITGVTQEQSELLLICVGILAMDQFPDTPIVYICHLCMHWPTFKSQTLQGPSQLLNLHSKYKT